MTDSAAATFNGDCFIVAAKIILQATAPRSARLVHGLPIYRKPGPDYGKRFWHAWVESVMEGIPVVLDFSQGKEIVMPRDEFYRIGRIEQVFRYTQHQANRELTKTGNCGPWVPDWPSYEHPDFNGVGVGESSGVQDDHATPCQGEGCPMCKEEPEDAEGKG